MTKKGQLTIAARTSPFVAVPTKVRLDAPCTVAYAVQKALPAVWHEYALAVVNGIPVIPDAWQTTRLKETDCVEITVIPQGGGFRNILRSVLIIAAFAWAGGAGGRFFGNLLGGFRIGRAFAGAVGLLVVNALVPPHKPQLDDLSGSGKSTVYSITGAQNSANYYGAVPVVLGTHRIFPPYAARPYTLIKGNDQYLCCLFAIGYGPLTISDLKIGDTALSSYSDVEYEIREGTAADAAITLFPRTVTESLLSIALTYAAGYQTRTTVTDSDMAIVDVNFPQGLYRINSHGHVRDLTVALEIMYRPTSGGSWTSATDHYISGLSISNAGSGYTEGSWDLIFTGGGGSGAAGTAYVTIDEFGQGKVTAVSLTAHGTGYTSSPTVTLDPAAGGTGATFSVTRTDGFSFTARSTQPLRRSFTVEFPSRGQYDIRIRRLTADSSDTDHIDKVYWTAMRSVKNEAPVDTPYNLAMVALRVKATGQLNGVIDTFNCIASSRCTSWDSGSSSWVSDQVTNNPADLFRHLLQGAFNGNAVADSRIDLTQLQAWSEFCTTKGFTFNAVLDSAGTLQSRMDAVCAAGRASHDRVNNKYTVYIEDTQTTPVQIFTPRNSRDFSASRVFVDMPHAFRVRFVNEDNDYLQDTRVVYADGYDAATATKFEQLELFGVTDKDQIWKLARYHLAVATNRQETFTITVDCEHLVCTRGDLVELAHDVPLVGLAYGRVKAVTNDTITVDEICTMESGKTYAVDIRLQNGTISTWALVTNVGDQTVLSRDTGSTGIFNCSVGDIFVFGESGSVTQQCLVQQIQHSPDLSAKLTLIPYASDVYTADSGSIPSYSPVMTLPDDLKPLSDPRNLEASEFLYRESGTLEQGVDLTWVPPENQIPENYEVQILRPGADTYESVGVTNFTQLRINHVPAGTYSFRVRAMQGLRSSAWVDLTDEPIEDLSASVADVEDLRTGWRDNHIILQWGRVDDAVRAIEYEVRYGEHWDSATLLVITTGLEYKPLAKGTYLIKARADRAAYSSNAASVTVTALNIVDNVVDTTDEQGSGWLGTFTGGACPQYPSSWQACYEPSTLPEFLGWQVEYDGSVEPDSDGWTLGGTDYGSSDGDLFTISGMALGQTCSYFRNLTLGANQGVIALGRFKINSGATADQHAFCIYSATLGKQVYIKNLTDSSMKINGATTVTVDADAFNDFRLVLGVNNTCEVYINGALVFSGAPATYSGAGDGVYFGKSGTSADTAGSVWDYVKYTVEALAKDGTNKPDSVGWGLLGTDLATVEYDYLKITGDGTNTCKYYKDVSVNSGDCLIAEFQLYVSGSAHSGYISMESSVLNAGIILKINTNGIGTVQQATSPFTNLGSLPYDSVGAVSRYVVIMNTDRFWIWRNDRLILTGDPELTNPTSLNRIVFGFNTIDTNHVKFYHFRYSIISAHQQALLVDGNQALISYYTTKTSNQVDLGNDEVVYATVDFDYHGSDMTQDLLQSEDLVQEDDLLGNATNLVTVEPQIRIKPDGGSWGDWQVFVNGTYQGRYFDVRLRVSLANSDLIAYVTAFSWTIDMEDVIQEAHSVNIPAGGTPITFDKIYQETPVIQVTQVGAASGDTVIVTGKSVTGFTVQILDSGGSGKAAVVDWIAKGY